jgi:hypothetical protein
MAKMTVQFSTEMEEVLEVLSDVRGLPKTQVLRDAVRLMKYLDDEGRSADLVLRSREDGSERQLVLESQLRSSADTPRDTSARATQNA